MSKTKNKVNKGLSDMQKLFANAINYDALDKALKDPKVVEILSKIK